MTTLETRGYAAFNSSSPLRPHTFSRREPGPRDVLIEILFCGICHSDLHQARDEWSGSVYPMVPGHEIIGRVVRSGAAATRFQPGARVGVGCLVRSCGACAPCKRGDEQYCERGPVFSYNSEDIDGSRTQGGYSTQIVVDEGFVLRIPDSLSPAAAAPLLCAGITTFSPLRRWKVGAGQRIAVVGLGGLGHMAVKLGSALGAEVTMISTSPGKRADAERLGAKNFLLSSDWSALSAAAGRFDFILDTVSAPHDLNAMLSLLRTDGALVLVGAPPTPSPEMKRPPLTRAIARSVRKEVLGLLRSYGLAAPAPVQPPLQAFSLIANRRTISGSLIGGLRETQEVLDFCAEHKLAADVEVIAAAQINEAYERLLRGDVKYRFVIDAASFRA